MPFPPVKSDPWKKGLKQKRRHSLWPSWFWTQLVKRHGGMYAVLKIDKISLLRKHARRADLSLDCIEEISEMNERLYGVRTYGTIMK